MSNELSKAGVKNLSRLLNNYLSHIENYGFDFSKQDILLIIYQAETSLFAYKEYFSSTSSENLDKWLFCSFFLNSILPHYNSDSKNTETLIEATVAYMSTMLAKEKVIIPSDAEGRIVRQATLSLDESNSIISLGKTGLYSIFYTADKIRPPYPVVKIVYKVTKPFIGGGPT